MYIVKYENTNVDVNNIYPDDNINIVVKKIACILSIVPEKIFIWALKKKKKESYMETLFIHHCFKKNQYISTSYFNLCCSNFFVVDNAEELDHEENAQIDKNMAQKIINRLKYKHIKIPLSFVFTQKNFNEYSIDYTGVNPVQQAEFDIHDHSNVTLDYFDLSPNDIINIITLTEGVNNVFFPQSTSIKNNLDDLKQFINTLSKTQNRIEEHVFERELNNKSSISFAQFRVDEKLAPFKEPMNLSHIFDKFHATELIPFIKYHAKTNIWYKLHKDSLIAIGKNNLDKWTFYRNSKVAFVIFKLVFDSNMYCTVTINALNIIDVKFNIGVDGRKTIKNIEKFYNVINEHIFSQIEGCSLMSETNVSIINIVSHNIIGNAININQKIKDFENVVTSMMYPYFNVITVAEKNTIYLQYKRIDNFATGDIDYKIDAYISSKYSTMEKKGLIANIQDNFNLTEPEARNYYDLWENKAELLGLDDKKKGKKYVNRILPYINNGVNVRLRLSNKIDARYMISGIYDLKIESRIIRLIKILMDIRQTTVKAPNINFDNQAFTNDIVEDVIEDDENDVYDEEFERLMNASDDEADIIEEEIEEESVKVKGNKGKPQGYTLLKLKEADIDLFNYASVNVKKRQDYASLCGSGGDRQPIVINNKELKNIDKIAPGSYNGYLRLGSTPQKAEENVYICPQIWCPHSRASMTYEQYIANNKQCYEPSKEQPVLFKANYWGQNHEKALQTPHYIGVFNDDNIHPKKLCVPCCFKKQFDANKVRKCNMNIGTLESSKFVVVEGNDNVIDTGNERYILDDSQFPLKPKRFGILPEVLRNLWDVKSCTKRENGAGIMENGSMCILRRGIDQEPQPFINCIETMMDGYKIKLNKINIKTYIALENGKILRMFINPNYDINNPTNFNEFSTWFLSQTQYIEEFNLHDVQQNINNKSSSVIREFMIYNSYKHFTEYLQNNDTFKDHRILLDLINIEQRQINQSHIHFIIIERDPLTNECYINCPYNRNVKELINYKNPFGFLLYSNKNYEPICTVGGVLQKDDKDIHTRYNFMYEKESPAIKKFIDTYINNCGKDVPINSIDNFIKSLNYKIKSHVIDYSFNIRGILLVNDLYIPYPENLSMYSVFDKTNGFTYFTSLRNVDCKIEQNEIEKIFKELEKFTKDKGFYTILNFIDDFAVQLTWKKTIIPLKTSNNTTFTFHRTIDMDLDIFIGDQTNDERVNVMQSVEAEKIEFIEYYQTFIEYISKTNENSKQLEFIRDSNNPLPLDFKRKKLYELLNGIPKSKHTFKLVEALLGRYADPDILKPILMQSFSVNTDEMLIEQVDIHQHKLDGIINIEKDPFLFENNIQTGTLHVYYNNLELVDMKSFTNNLPITEMPCILKTILPNYKVADNTRTYSPFYLYAFFINVNQYINPFYPVSKDVLKSFVRLQLVKDFEENNIENIKMFRLNNSKYKAFMIHDCLNVIDTNDYYPGLYEIQVLSKVIGINVFISARSGKRAPDGLFVFDNKSKHMILLKESKHEVDFWRYSHIIRESDSTLVFRMNMLTREFKSFVKKKVNDYFVDIED